MSSSKELYLIANELRAIANMGLYRTQNIHDRERYEKILTLSARMAGTLTQHTPDEILSLYREHMTHVCPFLGAEAAVFKSDNIMLIKRHDDKLWAIPGGITDVGESWAEAAIRELQEETRLKGTATQLIGIFDSRKWKNRSNLHLYHAVFEVTCKDLNPQTTWEATEIDFFSENNLPPLSRGLNLRVPFILKRRREKSLPYFDTPENQDAP
ncbi:MAG: NUDIX hydrolase N-terminal domain-containing protein [Candidatus Latescibacteria bacterium]|jgi:ADP-ribose pyrophosphatase YjhB (NUDIX family)|nr:NUDIX hydrolase N-terminal domain-containing protein [Candidatus Latescibacterota bacterium]